MSETVDESELARKRARRSRMRKARRAMVRPFMRWLVPWILRLLALTWRTEFVGLDKVDAAKAAAEGGGHFMASWHGRMILGMPLHGNRGWQVLVSHSSDGDLSESLLESFGYQVIRGSSSRGGARALRTMLHHLRRGDVLVITPDGPRGPLHSMNPGLAWMARATGYPVVPCGCACNRAWRARSWDRMTVPKPFAKIVIQYGEPISVAREGGEEELAAASDAIQRGIIEAERAGFERLGVEADW